MDAKTLLIILVAHRSPGSLADSIHLVRRIQSKVMRGGFRRKGLKPPPDIPLPAPSPDVSQAPRGPFFPSSTAGAARSRYISKIAPPRVEHFLV